MRQLILALALLLTCHMAVEAAVKTKKKKNHKNTRTAAGPTEPKPLLPKGYFDEWEKTWRKSDNEVLNPPAKRQPEKPTKRSAF